MRWSVRLRACLVEGKTPHGAPSGRQRRQRPDAYQRHAVVAIVAGRRKNRPAHRKDADVAHDIARGVATTKWGPKLPYYRRGTHTQTPRGKVNIRRHQREASRAAKDAQYDRLVGKRAAQFERPWTVKGEAVDRRLRTLIEAVQGVIAEIKRDEDAKKRADAEIDRRPLWRVTISGITSQEAGWVVRYGDRRDESKPLPWEARLTSVKANTQKVRKARKASDVGDLVWVNVRNTSATGAEDTVRGMVEGAITKAHDKLHKEHGFAAMKKRITYKVEPMKAPAE